MRWLHSLRLEFADRALRHLASVHISLGNLASLVPPETREEIEDYIEHTKEIAKLLKELTKETLEELVESQEETDEEFD